MVPLTEELLQRTGQPTHKIRRRLIRIRHKLARSNKVVGSYGDWHGPERTTFDAWIKAKRTIRPVTRIFRVADLAKAGIPIETGTVDEIPSRDIDPGVELLALVKPVMTKLGITKAESLRIRARMQHRGFRPACRYSQMNDGQHHAFHQWLGSDDPLGHRALMFRVRDLREVGVDI